MTGGLFATAPPCFTSLLSWQWCWSKKHACASIAWNNKLKRTQSPHIVTVQFPSPMMASAWTKQWVLQQHRQSSLVSLKQRDHAVAIWLSLTFNLAHYAIWIWNTITAIVQDMYLGLSNTRPVASIRISFKKVPNTLHLSVHMCQLAYHTYCLLSHILALMRVSHSRFAFW